MRRTLPAVILLLASAPGSGRAEDDPRAVVERAVQAAGGADLLEQPAGVVTKFKGKLLPGGQINLNLEGEILTEGSKRSRLNFTLDLTGDKHRAVVVVNGDRSWRGIDGDVSDFTAEDREMSQTSAYADRVTGLVALLKDRGFTLTTLPPVEVAGRPARGVKASYKGKPDVSLYFDRETGLLVKYAYRGKVSTGGGEVLKETVLSDHRRPVLGAAEEAALKEAHVSVAGPALVEYLRQQAPDPARLEKARTLVRQLGDDSFEVREKATAGLVTLGAVALPLVRDAVKSKDPEVARRASACLQQIGEDGGRSTLTAAVRLAAIRRPAGAAGALLDLLPGADADLTREVKSALCALAQAGGVQPDEALVKALADRDPARRAAAAAALGKDGGAFLNEPRRRLYTRPPVQAMKTLSYYDGKLQMEMEALDVQLYNRFDDKEFAKP
jgi:hypothetical protein